AAYDSSECIASDRRCCRLGGQLPSAQLALPVRPNTRQDFESNRWASGQLHPPRRARPTAPTRKSSDRDQPPEWYISSQILLVPPEWKENRLDRQLQSHSQRIRPQP